MGNKTPRPQAERIACRTENYPAIAESHPVAGETASGYSCATTSVVIVAPALSTGKVRPSTADDRVTKALGVVPDFTSAPVVLPWYLRELITGCVDPAAVQEYIRWYWRRSLTGDCSVEVFLFLFGPPRSGQPSVTTSTRPPWPLPARVRRAWSIRRQFHLPR